MADPLLDDGRRRVAHAQAVGGVVPHRHPGKDRLALEHHGILRPFGARRRVDLDRAGGRGLEPGEDAQQRRLAAARRADDHEELARLDVDRDAVDGDELAEGLLQIADADGRPRRLADDGRSAGRFADGTQIGGAGAHWPFITLAGRIVPGNPADLNSPRSAVIETEIPPVAIRGALDLPRRAVLCRSAEDGPQSALRTGGDFHGG